MYVIEYNKIKNQTRINDLEKLLNENIDYSLGRIKDSGYKLVAFSESYQSALEQEATFWKILNN